MLPAHRSFYVPGTGHESWNKEAPALRFLVREDLLQKVTEVEQWTWCFAPLQAEHNAWPQQILYQRQLQHQVRPEVVCRHTGNEQRLANRPVPLVTRWLS